MNKMNEKQLLDSVEKEYLENIIKPFRKNIYFICKMRIKNREQLVICYGCNDNVCKFPMFKKGKMYRGMQHNTRYTISELGLFEEEKTVISDTDLDFKSQSLLSSIENKLCKECKCFRNSKVNSDVYFDKNGEISKYIIDHAGEYEQLVHFSKLLALYKFGRTVFVLNNTVKEKNYIILKTDLSNVELTAEVQGLTENQKDYIRERCIYLWAHLFVRHVLNMYNHEKRQCESMKDVCSLLVDVKQCNRFNERDFVYNLYVTCGVKNEGNDEYHTFKVPLI